MYVDSGRMAKHLNFFIRGTDQTATVVFGTSPRAMSRNLNPKYIHR